MANTTEKCCRCGSKECSKDSQKPDAFSTAIATGCILSLMVWLGLAFLIVLVIL